MVYIPKYCFLLTCFAEVNTMIIRLAELPIDGNWDRCLEQAAMASELKPFPDLLLLPELFTIGFALDYIEQSAIGMDELKELPLAETAKRNGVWIAGGTFPVRTPRGIINMMPVFNSYGELVHTAEKIHLFRNMGEHKAFTPGTPTGSFDLKGIKAGACVCYDLRFPELFRKLTLQHAKIMLIPAQWPQVRNDIFRSFLKVRSAEAQVFTAGCNLGGSHLGTVYNGGGGVVSPNGSFLQASELSAHIKDFSLDLDEVHIERERIDCLRDRRPEVYGGYE